MELIINVIVFFVVICLLAPILLFLCEFFTNDAEETERSYRKWLDMKKKLGEV